jgi:hypothetical protein
MGDGSISSEGRDDVVGTESVRIRRIHALIAVLGAFLIYLTLAYMFFGRALLGHFSDRFIGHDADPPQMMWLLAWWPYALSHHLNPFLTDYVWAPVGFNFAWMTSTPLASIVAIPLTKTIGLVASLNVLTMLGTSTAALFAFILCRRISHSFWPSMLGGFVFGFSSYMLSETLAHLNLILVFPLPLAAYLVVRWFEGSLSARPFIALLALALTCEFLIDMEILATATLIAATWFSGSWYYSSPEDRRHLARLVPPAAAAYAIVAVIVSPYLYYFFFFGTIHQPLWPSERFSTDLLNFILPTRAILLGNVSLIANTASQFPGSIIERGGFIALPLTAITIAWARKHWSEPFLKALVLVLIVVLVAALGPYLQIDGRPIFPMPWLLLTHVPLLQHALPSRLMLFPPLAIAIIVSSWLAAPEHSVRVKAIASVTTVALMLPNLSANFWTSKIDTPAFFTDGSTAKNLSRSDTVLILPWGSTGNSMLWQAECGMCFRNVSGYTAMERFQVRRWPIVNYFLGSPDLAEPELQLKAFLANNGVTAIVIDDANANALSWKNLLASLGQKPTDISGVSLYRLRPSLLASYRAAEFSGLAMERRAIESRFATLITATDEYLASGRDPAHLSDDELVDLGLLPHDWKREPGAFSDMRVMVRGNGGAVIMAMGSKSALADTVARFRGSANVVYLPFPRVIAGTDGMSPFGLTIHNALLPPAAMPIDGESMQFLAMAFDRERLHKAAQDFARIQPRQITPPSLARR